MSQTKCLSLRGVPYSEGPLTVCCIYRTDRRKRESVCVCVKKEREGVIVMLGILTEGQSGLSKSLTNQIWLYIHCGLR